MKTSWLVNTMSKSWNTFVLHCKHHVSVISQCMTIKNWFTFQVFDRFVSMIMMVVVSMVMVMIVMVTLIEWKSLEQRLAISGLHHEWQRIGSCDKCNAESGSEWFNWKLPTLGSFGHSQNEDDESNSKEVLESRKTLWYCLSGLLRIDPRAMNYFNVWTKAHTAFIVCMLSNSKTLSRIVFLWRPFLYKQTIWVMRPSPFSSQSQAELMKQKQPIPD